jgi:probable rRNA maturation factor
MKIDEQAELSIYAVAEDEMERLHIEWMDEEGPTDVLSFPIDQLRPGQALTEEERTLGDVVICPAVAARQAKSVGHSTVAELQVLLVHGILHLLGFDHAEPAAEAEMFALQKEIILEWESAR